jgi:YidC/Oxa1 family membrane protein insertase
LDIVNIPLGHILRVTYQIIGDYGWSIVAFTLLIKLVLLPLSLSQLKSMQGMQVVQPKVKELQEKYKNNPEKQNAEIMKLYKEYKVNPMAGCLPLLVQFPILIGLYNVLRYPVKYQVFANEAALKMADIGFLWMPNLTERDIILAVLSGVTTYLSTAMTTTKEARQQPSQKMMLYMMPIMMFWWGLSFPAGLTLYWTVSNVFQLAQQYFITNPLKAKANKPREE